MSSKSNDLPYEPCVFVKAECKTSSINSKNNLKKLDKVRYLLIFNSHQNIEMLVEVLDR
jgi:hypothetical protein